jgi:hypothetical protein
LDQAGLTCADLDAVAYYEYPTKKLQRQVYRFSLTFSASRSRSRRTWETDASPYFASPLEEGRLADPVLPQQVGNQHATFRRL